METNNTATIVLSSGIVTSEKRGELLKSLQLFKREMVPVIRSSEASFTTKGGQRISYTYSSRDEILYAINQPLDKYDLIIEQLPHTDSGGVTRLTTMLTHIPSDQFTCFSVELFFDHNDKQSYGSACTYQSRYAIVMLLGLEQEDDDGNSQRVSISPTNKKATMVSDDRVNDDQVLEIVNLAGGDLGLIKEILSKTKRSKLEELTVKQYHWIKKEYFQ